MGRKVPLRCSGRLHSRLLRPFSDSFLTEFSEVAPSQAIWRCAGLVAMASCLCSRERGLANGRASREGAHREPCTPE